MNPVLLTSRCESGSGKGVKSYISARMIDGAGENPIFHKLWSFFTASNAQKIKVKSIFHIWEDQMI